MTFPRRLFKWAFWSAALLAVLGALAILVAYWLISPRLPDVQGLRSVELQLPMSVHSKEGKLIALFGEARRYPVVMADVPDHVRLAVLAIEDARFYEHPGIDWRGITRAVWLLATTRDRRVPGGSTITQQVAKQFFLSSEYSYTRKLTEIFLALKMERELSKDEILELYLNKSFFGNRAYGIAAAAEFYYGKSLGELSLAEAATLAAIPKFPSSGNPLVNPQRALIRRNYVLERMREENYVRAEEARAAQAEPIGAGRFEPPVEVDAPYVAEMVRQAMVERYGDDALNQGYRVYTTISEAEQAAAQRGIAETLLAYDRRHGWRGPEQQWSLSGAEQPAELVRRLAGLPRVADLIPAVVLSADGQQAQALTVDGQQVRLDLESVRWASRYIDENRRGAAPKAVSDVLAPGDVVRLRTASDDSSEGQDVYILSQLPKVQGALVALDPEDGALRALVGGFNFSTSKFNRALQSQRNPGSSFKPFVYAAAFERGFHPASIVLDAPVVLTERASGKVWQPQNDNETFGGPMRLREAMVTSRNLVSIRILDAIGVGYARRYMQNFGFPASSLPENLTLALGTSALSPLQVATGYAVFANGGYRVEPWFIDRIEDREGVTVFAEHAPRACDECPLRRRSEARSVNAGSGFDLGPATEEISAAEFAGPPVSPLAPRAIDERTAFLIRDILRDVVRRGTGRGALVLGRGDLGGKTGTTNEFRDAWFSGFGTGVVTTAWVGMDDFSSLGRGEFGARAALPAWIEAMRAATNGVPEAPIAVPEGIARARVDAMTGWLAGPDSANTMVEYLKLEDIARMENQRARRDTEVTEKEAFDIF
jgi:penicillin-binding protein 1A